MPTAPSAISALPLGGQPGHTPAQFNTAQANLVTALATFVTQANAAIQTAYTNAAEANQNVIDSLSYRNQAGSYATSASNSAAAAAASAASLLSLQALWLGAAASDPTTGIGGAPLVAGNAYINSVSGYLRGYNGSTWVQGISAVAGVTSVNGLTGPLTEVVTRSASETLLNKTLQSPALTGAPTAPTPTLGDSSTKVATTSFVAASLAAGTTASKALAMSLVVS